MTTGTVATKRKYSKNAYLKGAARTKRDAAIFALAEQDEPTRVIAARFRLSETKIREVVKYMRAADYKERIAPAEVNTFLQLGKPEDIPLEAAIGERLEKGTAFHEHRSLFEWPFTLGRLKTQLETLPECLAKRALFFEFDAATTHIEKHLGPIAWKDEDRFKAEALERVKAFAETNTLERCPMVDFDPNLASLLYGNGFSFERSIAVCVEVIRKYDFVIKNIAHTTYRTPNAFFELAARCQEFQGPLILVELIADIHIEAENYRRRDEAAHQVRAHKMEAEKPQVDSLLKRVAARFTSQAVAPDMTSQGV